MLLLRSPGLALAAVRAEIVALAGMVQQRLSHSASLVMSGTEDQIRSFRSQDDLIDQRFRALITYMRAIMLNKNNAVSAVHLEQYLRTATQLEAIGDTIASDIGAVAVKRLRLQEGLSTHAQRQFQAIGDDIQSQFVALVAAMNDGDRNRAQLVIESKQSIYRKCNEMESYLAEGLAKESPDRVERFIIQQDLLAVWRRLYYIMRQIAKVQVAMTSAELRAHDAIAEPMNRL